jgi:hypothetical protein
MLCAQDCIDLDQSGIGQFPWKCETAAIVIAQQRRVRRIARFRKKSSGTENAPVRFIDLQSSRLRWL